MWRLMMTLTLRSSGRCRFYVAQSGGWRVNTVSPDKFGTSKASLYTDQDKEPARSGYEKSYSLGPDFLSCLRAAASQYHPGPPTAEQLKAITEEAETVIQELSSITDSVPRKINIEFTAYMVASYRFFKAAGTPVAQIRRVLEEAIVQHNKDAQRFTRQHLDSEPDPFSSMIRQCKEKEVDFYPRPDFHIERVRDERTSYHIEVQDCWYMNTLQKLGAREIGPAFCAFDRAWYDTIDPAQHGFRFSRPTTIARGEDACRFNFDRIPGDMEDH